MRILIRADGDREIGTGHVMRMVALAQAARASGGEVVLVSARLDAALEGRARRAGMSVLCGEVDPGSRADSTWVVEQAAARRIDWVVLDGYRFDTSYQERIQAAGFRLLFVDDAGGDAHYPAQIVLNQNIAASADMYRRRRDETQLLLGPAYALLREEFLPAAAIPRTIARRANRVLVTLGGADPENASSRILDALVRVQDADLRVKVLAGPSNPHFGQLVSTRTDSRIEVLPAAEEMTPLMTWADVAVASASVTVYELCCLGVPTLTVAIVDHQRALGQALEREGVCVNLGVGAALDAGRVAQKVDALRADIRRRTELSHKGRELVDARGARRVVEAMNAGADA